MYCLNLKNYAVKNIIIKILSVILVFLLVFTASALVAQNKITFTTTKSIGEKVILIIYAEEADKPYVWIDLNNNGIREENEGVTSFGYESYTIASPIITLYGNVTRFDCQNNQLISLDVSQNNALTYLTCSNNALTSIDVSNNTVLKYFDCQNAKLISLDFSKNTSLEYLNCTNNKLRYLAINNGNNENFVPPTGYSIAFKATENPDLYCIKVDEGFEPAGQPSGKKWLKDDVAIWDNNSGISCEETIADSFKISFVTTKSVGEKISLSINADEKDKPYVWLDLNNNGVKDLGEEVNDFMADNTTTDYILGAQNISLYGKVSSFFCARNDLIKLDIFQNPFVEILDCSENNLTDLDIYKNDLLLTLVCYGNDISELSIENNLALNELNCSENSLRNLNVSQNTKLALLNCNSNSIKELDTKSNVLLNYLDCSGNRLSKLNVSNGRNDKFTYFDATGNVYLDCIQIDDDFVPESSWKKDEYTVWNNDSSVLCAEITSDNYRIALTTAKSEGDNIGLKIFSEEADKPYVWIDLNNNGTKDENEAVTYFGYKKYIIEDQTITIHGKIKTFYCKSSQLTSLDVSDNIQLVNLTCSGNELTNLNVNGCTGLVKLECARNNLDSLDVDGCTSLKSIKCFQNNLINLDVTPCSALEYLSCQENKLTSIDVSDNIVLEKLFCYENELASLEVSSCLALAYLDCSKNNLSYLSVNNGNNSSFSAPEGYTSAFDATGNLELKCIDIDDGFTPDEYWLKDETASWHNDIFPCYPDATDDLPEWKMIKVYPNPATNVITVEQREQSNYKALQLLDLSGKVILKKEVESKLTRIDVSKFSKGVYFVKEGNEVRKILIN